MGAVLAILAVPPLSIAVVCWAAVRRDRRGTCHPCGRWPLHHTVPAADEMRRVTVS